MTAELLRWIDAFADLSVLVIGEAMVDSYLEGSSDRLCQEAPVPVVAVEQRTDAPGGAANTAANLRALGSRVAFLSVVGDDPEAAILRRTLATRDVGGAHLIVQPGRRTLAKHRVAASGHLLVRFDQGDTSPVDAGAEAALIDRLAALWARVDAVVVSDYRYGVLTPRVRDALGRLQARCPRVLSVDARDLPAYRDLQPTVVKPNYGEMLGLLGRSAPAGPRAEAVGDLGHEVLERTGARIAAVTLDADGALIFERGRPTYRTYARPTPNTRAAGAGDTFIGTLTLALAAGAHTPAAAELAAAAAGVVVARERTSACTGADLRRAVTAVDKLIGDRQELAALVAECRRQGRRIVFTNGCFDILHRGHITFLSRARSPGDVLIVGLNDDAGVRRLKGAGRPINRFEDRAQVLGALSCVDHLIAFSEDTPEALIETIRPDIVAKGGNYRREDMPEAVRVEALGGVVRILPYVQDHSTRAIVARASAAASASDEVRIRSVQGVTGRNGSAYERGAGTERDIPPGRYGRSAHEQTRVAGRTPRAGARRAVGLGDHLEVEKAAEPDPAVADDEPDDAGRRDDASRGTAARHASPRRPHPPE